MFLVPSFLELLQPLSSLLTAPSFQSFLTIICGWVFARRRTVTAMILAAGAVPQEKAGAKHYSAYFRFFASARWSLDEMGLAVFALLRPLLGPVVLLGIDDTLARKRGLKIFGVGMHHDPLLSSSRTALVNWGHCWVVLGVICRLPCCGQRSFCLPILFRLYVPKQTAEKKHLEPPGGGANGAGGDAALFAGGALVQPRRPPPLPAAPTPLVPPEDRRLLRRHAGHPALPEPQERGFRNAPPRPR